MEEKKMGKRVRQKGYSGKRGIQKGYRCLVGFSVPGFFVPILLSPVEETYRKPYRGQELVPRDKRRKPVPLRLKQSITVQSIYGFLHIHIRTRKFLLECITG
ncbi:MAG TPA: hypothetical protein PLG43_00605 [Spirochaetia bacterium]|nr:hypothetical protein [Spirochaetia bacterium]